MFLYNFLNISNTEVKVTDSPINALMSSASFVFGLIFWGNLIDNAVNPKFILLICEGSIAVAYLLLGYIVINAVTPGLSGD